VDKREKILERDNHQCKICGYGGKRLAIHHIDCDKLNNKDINLVTLCNSCHMEIHNLIRRVKFESYKKDIIWTDKNLLMNTKLVDRLK